MDMEVMYNVTRPAIVAGRQTSPLIGFFQIMTNAVVCGLVELAAVWAARWGEGRGWREAHFAAWHTACCWTFRWDGGMGEVTDTVCEVAAAGGLYSAKPAMESGVLIP